MQVKPQIGLTFASALRSFLRHDPDIMMIGEIRDLETAQIAVQAALTGHLILSTLHTNDAASAVTRLLDMGVEDYLLTSTINGVAAQRLVRTLCPHCREAYEPPAELIEKLQLGDLKTLWRSIGCERCSRTGFKGRSSIVEVLPLNNEMRREILKEQRRRRAAAHRGRVRHADHARARPAQSAAGQTTIEEVLRATRSV